MPTILLPLLALSACLINQELYDERTEALSDQDGDGALSVEAGGSDCDDTDADVFPGADEVCNNTDDDCDGDIDEDPVDGTLWYPDEDADQYGDGDGETVTACARPSAHTDRDGDCDDTDAQVNPAAEEVPYDGVDNDCDEGDLTDADADGYDSQDAGGDDCDDTDPSVFPGASDSWYDGVDSDCGGEDDDDADGDGAASEARGGDDCDDDDPDVYPDSEETWANGATDNNCDGLQEVATAASSASSGGLASNGILGAFGTVDSDASLKDADRLIEGYYYDGIIAQLLPGNVDVVDPSADHVARVV